MKIPDKLELLDCTIRDGGYINDWSFSDDFGQSLYGAVSESGCSYIEIGFFNPKTKHQSPWCNCTPSVLCKIKGTRTGGAGIAVMIDFGSCELSDIPDPKDYPVDLIRVATPKKNRAAATEFAAQLARRGFQTTINYMAITEYSNEEILDLVTIINRHKDDVKYFYVADSFGSLLPARAREVFSVLSFGTNAKLGFHPHNNLQLAFANSLEAIEAGFAIIDGSIYGMGRGAGNLFLEAALAFLEKHTTRFKLLPVLQFADLFVDALKNTYSWGYSLPQLISGVLSCHPNYPTNLLAEKLYTADEIYHMLQKLSKIERARFNLENLESLKSKYGAAELLRSKHLISPTFQREINLHRSVLLLAGGFTVRSHSLEIQSFAKENDTLVISINNPAKEIGAKYILFANRRRLLQHYTQVDRKSPVIFSQSIHSEAAEQFGFEDVTWLNVAKILPTVGSPFQTIVPTNSAVEGILALASCGVKNIFLAGLDGFSGNGVQDYYGESMDNSVSPTEADKRNETLRQELSICRRIALEMGFNFKIITPTKFTDYSL